MSTETDLKTVEKVIEGVNAFPWRLKRQDGKPGGLIELPPEAVPIVVGDLHSCRRHLELILAHDGNYDAMKAGKRILVIIGDTVHNDQTGQMREMVSSVDIFDYIMNLMAELPKAVIYLKGNHDTFDERLVKSGIFQGKEFKKTLTETKGPDYTAAVQRLFDTLPLFVIGEGYVITHAGPVRGGINRDELIHITDYPDKYHQLIWNRLHEFRGTPSMKEYGEKDIEATLAKLDLSNDTYFLVGHNPLWGTGEKTGVWLDVLGIKKHHIIYSGHGTLAPYFLIQNRQLETRFTTPKPKEERYYG